MVLKIVKRDEVETERWFRKQQVKAAEILERMGLDPKTHMNLELGWLLSVGRYVGDPLRFDAFQARFLTEPSKFRSQLKCRQVGFSFSISCESLARTHIKEKHTAVCVSYNLDDAKEKIALVKELHDELPLEFQKKMVEDSKTVVGFVSNSHKRRVSRVISYPSKAPRGKTGDCYLDELAHCANDDAIYKGATALISRSGGQLTIGSSPMGQRGKFYEIHTRALDPKKYGQYWRQKIPWWLCQHFSTISRQPELVKLAATLPTELRVERYGTEKIKEQFDVLPLEDFQQEFECAFQDERVSYFPYDLILPCCDYEADAIPVYRDAASLAAMAPKLNALELGFDVGRTRHPSELFVFENDGGKHIMRYSESFKDVPFPQQRRRIEHILGMLGNHWRQFRIDATGLGKNLAEDLQEKFGSRRIKQVTFTNKSKEELASNLKILLQERNIVMPRDRALIAQIHAVKQKITTAGNSIYDVDKNRHHHGDKLWAIALAVFKVRKKRVGIGTLHARVVGEDKTSEDKKDIEPEKKAWIGDQLLSVPGTPNRISSPEREHELLLARQASERNTMKAMTLTSLTDRAKIMFTSARAYKRNGDQERYRECWNEYKRLRQAINRKKVDHLGLPIGREK